MFRVYAPRPRVNTSALLIEALKLTCSITLYIRLVVWEHSLRKLRQAGFSGTQNSNTKSLTRVTYCLKNLLRLVTRKNEREDTQMKISFGFKFAPIPP